MSLPSKRIALYVGDELYPANGIIQTSTIQALQASPLTSPILCLLNGDTTNNTLVYNDGTNPMFDTTGTYIGPANWPQTVSQLRSSTIKEIYISFSTSGTDWMIANPTAISPVLLWLKNTLGVDGIDLDYEGYDFSPTGSLYVLSQACVTAGLKVTAAPFGNLTDWQAWVNYVQGLSGTVSWLNLQCYAGGMSNNPGDWNIIGVPIVAGSCRNCCCPQTTCSPADIEKLFMLWRTGYGSVSTDCWTGVPNTSAQLIGGGFFWAYSSIKDNNFLEYMSAMKAGLEDVLQ